MKVGPQKVTKAASAAEVGRATSAPAAEAPSTGWSPSARPAPIGEATAQATTAAPPTSMTEVSERFRPRVDDLQTRARALAARPLLEREAELKRLLASATTLGNEIAADAVPEGTSGAVNLSAFRAELTRLARPSADQVMVELQQLTPDQRAGLLKGWPQSDRDQYLGDTAFDPTRRDVGAAYDFDFGAFKSSRSFDGETAWGMAVLSKRAYEPRDVVVPELERHGFAVTVLGGDPPDGYLAIKGDQALLTFRGTIPSRWEDVKTDLKFVTTEGVHTGFLNKSKELWEQLSRSLADAQATLPHGQKLALTVTGHSLGAAVGTLAAERIDRELPNTVSVDGVYTFGSPRLFKAEQAAAYNEALGERTYRLVKNTDLVTTLPPELALTHVGQRLFIDRTGVIKPGATDGDIIKSRLISPLTSLVSGSGGEAQFLPWAFDHSPQGYVKNAFVESNRPVDLGRQRDEHFAYWLDDRQPVSVALAFKSMGRDKRAEVSARFGNDPIFQQAMEWLRTGELPSSAPGEVQAP